MTDPWMQDSIFLASPEVFKKWMEVGQQAPERHPELVNSLWRYIFRAYSRPTPYGLFSGTGVGQVHQHSQLIFDETSWYTVTRPDYTVLEAIAHSIEQNPQYRDQLQYTLNNSLYRVLDEFRFSEFSGEKEDRKIALASYPATDELAAIVTYLNEGRQASLGQLISLFPLDNPEEVAHFIEELIDSGFLISNLTFPVTGQEMSYYLLNQLGRLSPTPVEHTILNQVAQLKAGSVQSFSNRLQNEVPIGEETIPTRSTSLVHTDLFFKPQKLTLSNAIINKLSKQFNRLLSLLKHERTSHLEQFAQRFYHRFDRQQIDLLTALDSEVGVGFTDETVSLYPVLVELGFSESIEPSVKPDKLAEFREVLYNRYQISKSIEIEITDQDLQQYTQPDEQTKLPSSWYLHGELYSTRLDNTEQNQSLNDSVHFALNAAVATSAAVILGRFCHGHPELQQLVKELCDWEQSQTPDSLLAEIVHLPTHPMRSGNVVARPVLRSYEIPYITPASVEATHTIPLSDILVSATESGQVYLRSKTTGKQINPRLSSAHNPVLGDEIYQFLVAIQHQNQNALGWSWRALNQMVFLPRLKYKNIIITPAQWIIRKAQLPAMLDISIKNLKDLYQLPRYVLLVESDNKLLLDLTFEPAQKVLLTEINKQAKVTLKEWLGESHSLWVTNGSDTYVSEVVIPMKTVEAAPGHTKSNPAQPSSSDYKESPSNRLYLPGSEWIYYKIYVQEAMSDLILLNVVMPIWQKAKKRNWADSFFFIRYQDPDYHVRVRFLVKNRKHINRLLEEWRIHVQPYVESLVVHKVSIDTYFPEIERYTPALLQASEAYFSADSILVLNWLSLTGNSPSEEDRFKFAIASGQALLADLSIGLSDRVRICLRLQASFLAEQVNPKSSKQQLNAFYRKQQTYLSPLPYMTQLLVERSEQTLAIRRQIIDYFVENQNEIQFDAYVSSLFHMSMNRIFKGQQRKHELVVYHFLSRYYETLAAQNKSI